jgi:undecaprenyl diphosphate synthase
MTAVKKPAPKHIAIIMDGNGRWAKSRGLPRTSGHQRGVISVRNAVKNCAKVGVETLTLFAFSRENKSRPNKEVSLLFNLFLSVLNTETKKLNQNNVHLNIIGDLSIFPEKTQKLAIQAQQDLQQNTGLNLVIAANYSGQWDIVEATKKIATKSANEKLSPKDIDDKVFEKHTSLAKYPPVDLLIRTSGEVRLSNFLLWDIAYSELYFCNTLWPDFGTKDLNLAIENFHARDRRYGSHEDK